MRNQKIGEIYQWQLKKEIRLQIKEPLWRHLRTQIKYQIENQVYDLIERNKSRN